MQNETLPSETGSAASILKVIEEVGPLEFAEGELERLLADLEEMRLLDMGKEPVSLDHPPTKS